MRARLCKTTLAALAVSAILIAMPRTATAPRDVAELTELPTLRRSRASRSSPGVTQPLPPGNGRKPSVADTRDITDTVTTLQGDRLTGSVVGIGADGRLRLTAPHYDGEVRLRASALDQVLLPCEHAESGDDEIALTNGDRIVCKVTAITPEAVIFESSATGALKVSRKVVRSISFSKGTSLLLDSHFDIGGLDPWVMQQGSWTVKDDALVSYGSGNRSSLYARVEQHEPVTVVAKVQSLAGSNLYVEMTLFADSTESSHGRNSLWVRFYSSEYYLYYTQNGSSNSIINRPLGRSVQGGELRLAYDPESGQARLWLDTTDLGQYTVPNKPARGSYVMFASYYSSKTSSICVYRGIVPPTKDGTAAEEHKDTVEFGNKDRISADSLALSEETLTLTTSYGELRCPAERVSRVVFRKEGQEEPRRHQGDVWVETPRSRFTLQFGKLDGDYLIGHTEHLGEVKIRRDAIRRIRFNIYR